MASDSGSSRRPNAPRVLCLHGSPRSGGNTDLLLEALSRGAEEAGARVEHIHARSLDIRSCTGCGSCSSTGACVIRDEMAVVYDAVGQAAAIAVGSPVYFLGLPSRLKGVIDRFQPFWARRYLLEISPGPERPGALLAAAGSPMHSVFTCAQRTAEAFFEVVGVTCRSYLLYEGVDEKGAIRGHPTALEEARRAGEALATQCGGRDA